MGRRRAKRRKPLGQIHYGGRRALGVGKGWRVTNNGRRRYPVREPEQPIDIDRLEAESEAVAGRWPA